MTLPKVKTEHAFKWECPNCGSKNFAECEVQEFASWEEKAEVVVSLGKEPWDQGEVLIAPSVVTCGWCKSEFEPEGDE